MTITINENSLNKMFLYRSFLYKYIRFNYHGNDKKIAILVEALNIKNRYKRIYFVIDNMCDFIDNYYKGINICQFKKGTCLCHRSIYKNYKNGCCRKCFHQSNSGCTTKNFACKMFNCSYVKKNYKVLSYEDIPLLKVLTPVQRLIIKSDYFSTIEEVSSDLYYGPIVSTIRMTYRFIKMILTKK